MPWYAPVRWDAAYTPLHERLGQAFIKARGDGLGFSPLSRAAFELPPPSSAAAAAGSASSQLRMPAAAAAAPAPSSAALVLDGKLQSRCAWPHTLRAHSHSRAKTRSALGWCQGLSLSGAQVSMEVPALGSSRCTPANSTC